MDPPRGSFGVWYPELSIYTKYSALCPPFFEWEKHLQTLVQASLAILQAEYGNVIATLSGPRGVLVDTSHPSQKQAVCIWRGTFTNAHTICLYQHSQEENLRICCEYDTSLRDLANHVYNRIQELDTKRKMVHMEVRKLFRSGVIAHYSFYGR